MKPAWFCCPPHLAPGMPRTSSQRDPSPTTQFLSQCFHTCFPCQVACWEPQKHWLLSSLAGLVHGSVVGRNQWCSVGGVSTDWKADCAVDSNLHLSSSSCQVHGSHFFKQTFYAPLCVSHNTHTTHTEVEKVDTSHFEQVAAEDKLWKSVLPFHQEGLWQLNSVPQALWQVVLPTECAKQPRVALLR